jgi:hypothetical protein
MTQPHVRNDHPVVFISDAWKPEATKQWVKNLAQELRENGVDVQLDQFHLKPGHDAQHFMEQMVTRPDVKKVLLVCTQAYKHKADRREGGAGTEAQIISPELANRVDQTKFVPLIRERDEHGKEYLPAFLASTTYIDFSNDDAYDASFEALLRDIFDRPATPPPPVGTPPSYITEGTPVLATAGRGRTIERALKQGQPVARGLLEDYGDAFVSAVQEYRLTPEQGKQADFDQRLVDTIHELRLYRDDFLGVLAGIARHGTDSGMIEVVHSLLERTLSLRGRPEHINSWSEEWYENFGFLCRDLFLCSVATLVRYKQYDFACYLLGEPYYFRSPGQYEGSTRSFTIFDDARFRGLDDMRRQRLQSNRRSYVADLMKECVPRQHFDFEAYKEMDFLLYLRSVLDIALLKEDPSHGYFLERAIWMPRTRIYMEQGNRFELFDRSQQPRYRDVVLALLGVAGKAEFTERLRIGGEKLGDWFASYGMGKFALNLANKWPD